MKPQPPLPDLRRPALPLTDYCFQSDLSGWHWASGPGDDDDSPAHRFNEFSREFLRESHRERQREMVVLGFIMLVAAWPVLYMIYSVIMLFLSGHSLDL